MFVTTWPGVDVTDAVIVLAPRSSGIVLDLYGENESGEREDAEGCRISLPTWPQPHSIAPEVELVSPVYLLSWRLRPGRFSTKYWHVMPRCWHREHSGFSFEHLTLTAAHYTFVHNKSADVLLLW